MDLLLRNVWDLLLRNVREKPTEVVLPSGEVVFQDRGAGQGDAFGIARGDRCYTL